MRFLNVCRLIPSGGSFGSNRSASVGVVTRDVEPYAIVAGVPARKVGERNRDLRYRLNFQPFLV